MSSKVTVLKSSFDLNNEVANILHRDVFARGILKEVKSNSVEITDEEIKEKCNYPSQEIPNNFQSGFLACWEYIKSKLQ